MITKYDWSNVPSEVNWIATSSMGFSSGFTDKPNRFDEYGFWDNGEPEVRLGYLHYFENWKDSLEERQSEDNKI